MGSKSPNVLTLEELMRRGAIAAARVEQFVPYAKVYRDMFGFCDDHAVMPTGDVWYVQHTTRSNRSSRRRKTGANLVARGIAGIGPRFHVEVWTFDEGRLHSRDRLVPGESPTGFVWISSDGKTLPAEDVPDEKSPESGIVSDDGEEAEGQSARLSGPGEDHREGDAAPRAAPLDEVDP